MVATVLCVGLQYIDSLSTTESLKSNLHIQWKRRAGAVRNGITLISVIPVSFLQYVLLRKGYFSERFLQYCQLPRFDLDLKCMNFPALTGYKLKLRIRMLAAATHLKKKKNPNQEDK